MLVRSKSRRWIGRKRGAETEGSPTGEAASAEGLIFTTPDSSDALRHGQRTAAPFRCGGDRYPDRIACGDRPRVLRGLESTAAGVRGRLHVTRIQACNIAKLHSRGAGLRAGDSADMTGMVRGVMPAAGLFSELPGILNSPIYCFATIWATQGKTNIFKIVFAVTDEAGNAYLSPCHRSIAGRRLDTCFGAFLWNLDD